MARAPIAERGPPLPSDATPYRTIGPFALEAIPTGLLRRHDLRDGAWAVLSVAEGSIRFCWDDDQGGSRIVVAGETMLIPPRVPHHLEPLGAVTIAIAFCAA